ncbi:MAG: histidine--tRNA ligase [Candidatus Velamenicoccus archaeovorus]
MLFKTPRGTKDILPPETILWQTIEGQAKRIFSLYAFQEIRTPVIEETGLFLRSLGDLSDIVQKQMFLIKKESDSFVLRPEATASVIRAYIESGTYHTSPLVKWFYIGPMFRAERPQKGRLRQFHHIGCEAIGSYSPGLDAELIRLAVHILREAGISGFEVAVNTLGCANDKKRLAINLKEVLLPKKQMFCEDCQGRMERNVFRVLDCKNAQCRENVAALSIDTERVCQDCRDHFESVKKALAAFGVTFRVDPLLVRGLDYYTKTVFEIKHLGLGAQDAIGAGGRYDNLVGELGGPEKGAVGFALGVERMLLARGSKEENGVEGLDCYIIGLGDAAAAKCQGLMNTLREAGIATDTDYTDGSLKSALRKAGALKAKTCVIVGDNELAKGVGLLKDMMKRTQIEVPLDRIVQQVKETLC